MYQISGSGSQKVLIYAREDTSKLIHQSIKDLHLDILGAKTFSGLYSKMRNYNIDLIILEQSILDRSLEEDFFGYINEIKFSKTLFIFENAFTPNSADLKEKIDDFIRLPIQKDLLYIRIANLLGISRRNNQLIEKNSVELDTNQKLINIKGVQVGINRFEMILIKNLLIHEPYLSIENIIEIALKESGKYYSRNNVRVKVHRLRNKIENQTGFKLIRNRRGEGYYLSF